MSMTCWAMFGTATLIWLTSRERVQRAALVELPGGVEHQQPGLVDGDPGVGDPLAVAAEVDERLAERRARRGRAGMASSRATSARPISRMQWCTRPGPSRPWAISKASPGPEMMLASGTRTSVNDTSPWPSGSS